MSMHPNRNKNADRASLRSGGMRSLLRFTRPYYAPVLIATLCAAVSSVLSILGPDRLSDLTNCITEGILTGIDMERVLSICLTLVAFYGSSFLLGLVQGQVNTRVNMSLSKKLRAAISEKINRLPIDYYNKTTFGDILSRITNDVDTISETVQRSVTNLVSAVTLLLGCLFMMFKTNWTMAVTAIVASLLGFLLMSVLMGRSQKYFRARQEWLGKINGHIEEAYTGQHIIKLYNGEAEASAQFEELNRKLYESNWKSQFLSGLMQPIMGFVGNLGYVSVCVVGAALVMNRQITFGVIVAFMVYVRLFTNPLSQIAQSMTSLQQTAAASGRVFEFLEAKELEDESHKTKRLETTKGRVEFDHVKFGYTPDKIIIHDFTETVEPGRKVAIVGPTGAGKTTLVNLLMRFYELDGGEIRIDGIPTTELTRENIHDLFGMVLQDTWLFEGTIRENVVYGKEGISDQRLKEVCKAVGMHHFIKTLPKGYDTVIDDKTNLSEGQKQLLTIARAMIENAPMLILDEATSSVDTRTEVLIQKAMDELTRGRTSFVIAHRLSTIKNADLILVLKDGDVVESGTHQELLAQNGFYAELYNSQFQNG